MVKPKNIIINLLELIVNFGIKNYSDIIEDGLLERFICMDLKIFQADLTYIHDFMEFVINWNFV